MVWRGSERVKVTSSVRKDFLERDVDKIMKMAFLFLEISLGPKFKVSFKKEKYI